ncbi:MAG: hypothetical protein KF845_02675 [Cyclobacteriaceae bacterium]|nr:hypothetical protein [Cyclobacteriaceae bacterium]
MSTQHTLVSRWLSRFFLSTFLVATLLLVSCGDDPEPAHEEELITTLTVTLTPTGGAPITMTFKDLDGDGGGAPEYIYSSGGNAAVLSASTTYTATITLLNESENPAEDITEEIEEEADEHLFCFTPTGANIGIAYDDEDDNGLPVGLTTTWTCGDAGTGTVKIVLRHQPGTKTGACPGPGESDIEVTFNVSIQ